MMWDFFPSKTRSLFHLKGETTDGTGSNGSAGAASATVAAGAAGPLPTSEQLLTWEKLSPAEFQQLQDFAACKSL